MALTKSDVTTENSCASLRRLASCRLPTSRRILRTRICDFLMSLAKLQRCPSWRVIHSSPDAWQLDSLPSKILGAKSLFGRTMSLMVPVGAGSQVGGKARKIPGPLIALIGSLLGLTVGWTFRPHIIGWMTDAVESRAILR